MTNLKLNLIIPVVGQSYFHKTEDSQVVVESICNQFRTISLHVPSTGGRLHLSLAGFNNLYNKGNLVRLDVTTQTYVIWNPSKIGNNYNLSKLESVIATPEGIAEVEYSSDFGWSSEVTTSNIEVLIQAFENEADVTMSYCTVAEYEAAKQAYIDSREPITLTVKQFKLLQDCLYKNDYDCRNILTEVLKQVEQV